MLAEGSLYTLAVVILIRVGQLLRALSENFQQCLTWVNILPGRMVDRFEMVQGLNIIGLS